MSIRGGDSHRKTASIMKDIPANPCATDCIEGPGPHSSRTFSAPGYAIDCPAGSDLLKHGAWQEVFVVSKPQVRR
jgi:hypothetical protein